MIVKNALPEFLGENLQELERWMEAHGEPRYRARQVLEGVFKKKHLSFAELAPLPKEVRAKLERAFSLAPLEIREEIRSRDKSVKFLFGLSDGNAVETVLIRTPKRRTLCVSTQVGCKFACRFCASGQAGFVRNLSAGEILAQVMTCAHRFPAQSITHIVFMGMGEPLDNFDALSRALESLSHPDGLAISRRRMTISTVGVIPKIERLIAARKPWELSISLHAPNDRIRGPLMPVNKAFPVDALLEQAKRYAQTTKRHVTFEYILIRGVNDSPEAARELAVKLRPIPCKVNLIPYNPIAEYPAERPKLPEIRRFEGLLKERGIRATVRFSKGGDIGAACGQLRLHHGAATMGPLLKEPGLPYDPPTPLL